MRRRILLSVALLPLLLGIAALLLLSSSRQPARAAAPGPQFSFGAPTLVSGKVQIPVLISGSGFSPYVGFALHLRWDPTVFHFSSATNTGGLFDAGGFCPAADPNTFDADGGGVQYSCTTLTGPKTATGQLALISITPLGTGCSSVHMFTYGPPDGGTGATGTYTVNDGDFQPQANTYGPNLNVNQAGLACTPVGTPTATPTPANTATPTATPTNTPAPVPTNTPISGAPDVTVFAASLPPGVDSGGIVPYSMVVKNLGDATATGVTLDMTVPLGAVPFKNGYCKTYAAGHFSCKLPNLAPLAQIGVVFNLQAPISLSSALLFLPFHVAAANEPPANAGNNDVQLAMSLQGCPDLTGDNVVNILDFAAATPSFGLHVGQPGYNPLADLNGDNMITIADLAIMASRYGANCRGLDRDHDGISDSDEINIYHTNPLVADTDGDGLPDGVEVLTYGSNPLVVDTSGDGYTDGQKAALGTDPTNYCPIMRADVNMDHLVNILDFSVAALTYGKASGDPGYNPRVDQNNDGLVNILDFSIMAFSYGKDVLQCP
ncbi:MAG: hypothetical protein ACYDEB_12735 [Dehalococcoidia bacterium]